MIGVCPKFRILPLFPLFTVGEKIQTGPTRYQLLLFKPLLPSPFPPFCISKPFLVLRIASKRATRSRKKEHIRRRGRRNPNTRCPCRRDHHHPDGAMRQPDRDGVLEAALPRARNRQGRPPRRFRHSGSSPRPFFPGFSCVASLNLPYPEATFC